jgi:hypothetical protein
MGTPIIPPVDADPVPAGELCTQCWGIGEKFGNIETPSSVVATIFGMEKADNWREGQGEPLDGDYTLEQRDGDPCIFDMDNDSGGIVWSVYGSQTYVFATNIENYSCFSGGADECELLIMNGFDNRFTGGSCLITIPEIEEE